SNLGGGEITELMTGGMGFVQPADKGEDKLDSKVERTATEAAKRKFSPEFMNRLDKVVVFHPLRPEQLEQILEIELGMVQQRLLFHKEGEGAVLPVATLQPRQPGIQVARASGGRAADLPAANTTREPQPSPPVMLPPGSPSPAPANRRKNESET